MGSGGDHQGQARAESGGRGSSAIPPAICQQDDSGTAIGSMGAHIFTGRGGNLRRGSVADVRRSGVSAETNTVDHDRDSRQRTLSREVGKLPRGGTEVVCHHRKEFGTQRRRKNAANGAPPEAGGPASRRVPSPVADSEEQHS